MIIPSTRIFTAGEIETGAYLNSAVTNLGNFMLGKPITVLRQTSVQSPNFTASTYTALNWNVADVNRDNNWTSSTPSVWTCNTAGWYRFAGQTSFSSVATTVSDRRNAWYKNSAQMNTGTILDRVSLTSQTATLPAQPVMVYMNVGDTMDLRAYTAGTGYTTSIGTGFQSFMSAEWVSL
jgi:hypothetical protein